MLYSGTDPESYITEYTLVYEKKRPGYLFVDLAGVGLGQEARDQHFFSSSLLSLQVLEGP